MVAEKEIKKTFERIAELYSAISQELNKSLENNGISSHEIDAATKYSKIFDYESNRTKNEIRYGLEGIKSTLNCFLRNYQREFSTYDFAYIESVRIYVKELDGLGDLLRQYEKDLQL